MSWKSITKVDFNGFMTFVLISTGHIQDGTTRARHRRFYSNNYEGGACYMRNKRASDWVIWNIRYIQSKSK